MKKVRPLGVLIVILIVVCEYEDVYSQSCFGEKRNLVVDSQMPYTSVNVGTSKGYFLLDFGTTASTIDTTKFYDGPKPKPMDQTSNRFDSFDFFGSWGQVVLSVQNHSNINLKHIKQAGIIGTDFLSLNIFKLDFKTHSLYRNTESLFCRNSDLIDNGFRPVSTFGYYSNELDKLNKLNDFFVPNIPTVPVRIGAAYGVAQIDPGFDDSKYHNSVNINSAFLKSISATGLKLRKIDNLSTVLSTCVSGVDEKVSGYKLRQGQKFEVLGIDGTPVLVSDDAIIFLKETPDEARKCGGIGTWQLPAAQIGASFLIQCESVVFDPFQSLVWFKK